MKKNIHLSITQAIMNIYKACRTVKESTIMLTVRRKADILINNNDYIVELNNLEL
jgi:hypothetical protein